MAQLDFQLIEAAIAASRNSRTELGQIAIKVGAALRKRDGTIVTACRGELAPGDHAEYTLLEKKLAADDLTGSVLAATLEPCTSRGTHTPCCDHIIRRGIAQVLVGSLDPNPRIRGLGYRKLVDNGVSVEFFPTDARKTVADENRHFIESFYQSQTLSGTVTFDYIATGGDFPLGNGENEFLTHWSNRGNGSVYCYPSHTLRAAIVPHRNIAEIESAAAWLEGVKGHVEPSEGEIVVLENSYGRFAAIKILKVRERQPGVQNALLQFDYQITSHPEGDFRPH